MPASTNDLAKLKLLKEKIELARGMESDKNEYLDKHKSASYAWRMVLELVVGMFIGVIIGYTCDYFLGTAPWMLIIMSMFGFGAGIRVMMRTAQEFNRVNAAGKKELRKN